MGTSFNFTPAAAAAASTLVHRALATPFVKPATLDDARLRLPAPGATSMGAAEVSATALELAAALVDARAGNERLARALCDPGGDHWSLVLNQFLKLGRLTQDRIIENLRPWADAIFAAAADRWVAMAPNGVAPWVTAEVPVIAGQTPTGKPIVRRPADAVASWRGHVDAVDWKMHFRGDAVDYLQVARDLRALPGALGLNGPVTSACLVLDAGTRTVATYKGGSPCRRRSA